MGRFVISPHFRLQEWVAEEKGYFRDEGLDYEFRDNYGPGDAAQKHTTPDKVGRVPDLRAGPQLRRERRVPLDGERRRLDGPRQALRRRLLGLARRGVRAAGVAGPGAGGPQGRDDLGRLPVGQPLRDDPGARAVHAARRHQALVRRRAAVPADGARDRPQDSGGVALQRAVLLPRAARLPQGHRHHVHDGHDDHRQPRTRRTSASSSARCGAPSATSTCGRSSTPITTGRNSRRASSTRSTRAAGGPASASCSSPTRRKCSRSPSSGSRSTRSSPRARWGQGGTRIRSSRSRRSPMRAQSHDAPQHARTGVAAGAGRGLEYVARSSAATERPGGDSMITLTINGKTQQVDVDPNTPLLWVIREQVGLTGTKYGCGVAQCGACTVHIDGAAVRSCSMPVERGRRQARSPPSKASRGRDPAQGAEGLARARRAAVRLLPVRHDHGGGGAPQDRSRKPDRRRHRRRDHQHLPLRHLPAGARSDPRRGEGSVREATMTACRIRNQPPLLPHQQRRRRRRPRARTAPSALRPGGRARGRRLARNHRLGGDPPGQHHRHPRRARRDGPGHDHRPRAARRRGARVRLEQGGDRVSDAGRERRAQARLGRVLHRRQPRHPPVARVRAQGRRRRAHDARPGRREPVEGSRLRMHGREQRHHAQPLGTEDDLRPGGRGRRAAGAAEGRAAQGSEDLEDRRQAGEAARHRDEGQRHDDLRHRTSSCPGC